MINSVKTIHKGYNECLKTIRKDYADFLNEYGFTQDFVDTILNMNTVDDNDPKSLLEIRDSLIEGKGMFSIRDIEKNWVLCSDNNEELKIVYNWFPFTTYDIGHGNMLINKTEQEMPPFFKHVRGSTNGIRVNNEIWFLCHLVSYEDRRYYYHILVSVDVETMKVNRWTKCFTFNKEKVEYVLGFVKNIENENEFMIGYSKMDKTTEFTMVGKKTIENLF